MDIIKAIIFGIVEGISEWLPISSTGHMILLEEFLKANNFSPEFWSFFLVVIQLGAILAVVCFFFNKLNPLSLKKEKEEKKETWILWLKVLIACLPAAVIGLLFDDFLDANLYNFITVSIMLVVYGILFIVVEKYNEKKEFKINDVKDISYKTALIIGGIQLLALIPGTSRSGVTILGAMLIGCNRIASAEFSFFLSIPIMLGASLLKGFKFFSEYSITTNELVFLSVGMIVAFVVSIFVIRFLLKFLKRNDFKVFGYYRIALGIILITYFFITY